MSLLQILRNLFNPKPKEVVWEIKYRNYEFRIYRNGKYQEYQRTLDDARWRMSDMISKGIYQDATVVKEIHKA